MPPDKLTHKMFDAITKILLMLGLCRQEYIELNSALSEYYSKFHKTSEWSGSVVNTMRAGLMSRLNELSLVKREKHGKNVRYHLTDAGEKYILNLSEKEEISWK